MVKSWSWWKMGRQSVKKCPGRSKTICKRMPSAYQQHRTAYGGFTGTSSCHYWFGCKNIRWRKAACILSMCFSRSMASLKDIQMAAACRPKRCHIAISFSIQSTLGTLLSGGHSGHPAHRRVCLCPGGWSWDIFCTCFWMKLVTGSHRMCCKSL